MANKTYRLEVVTPERLVLKEDVEFTSAPGAEGVIGILADHSPLLTALQIGRLEYTIDGKTSKLTVTGGFMEVGDNKVTVLSNAAERPVEIDLTRAEAARKRAEEQIEESKRGNSDIDLLQAELALKRALLRIETSHFS